MGTPENISEEVSSESPRVNRRDNRRVSVLPIRFVQLAVVAYLFVNTVASPMVSSALWGLAGASWVTVGCVILLLVTALGCWLKKQVEHDDTSYTSGRWVELLFVGMFVYTVYSFAAGIQSMHSWGVASGHDQPQYYSYLHSWVFDRDLDFENEYSQIPEVSATMKEGHPGSPGHNVAPIGTALLWIPFYLATHLVVLLGIGLGAPMVADGISSPYAVGVGFGGIVMGFSGLLLIYRVLLNWFSSRSAFFACVLVWFASPLQWYMVDQAWMYHTNSFFAGALALFAWIRSMQRPNLRNVCYMGAAIGLAMLVRPSHAVLIPLLVFPVVAGYQRDRIIRSIPYKLVAGFACVLLLFSPQLITWYLRSGFDGPPGSPMEWFSPSMLKVLFSGQHGLISWHPMTLFGFIGIPLVWSRSRGLAFGLSITVLLYWYANASIYSWWGGVSFGMRRFVGVLPFFSVGIAAVVDYIFREKHPRGWISPLVLVLCFSLYNGALAREVDPIVWTRIVVC